MNERGDYMQRLIEGQFSQTAEEGISKNKIDQANRRLQKERSGKLEGEALEIFDVTEGEKQKRKIAENKKSRLKPN